MARMRIFNVLLVTALLASLPFSTQAIQAVSTTVVISQVYGGGGNGGATYLNDYVVLFNKGTAPVTLTGWSIQYASSTGTGAFGANTGQLTPLSGIIAPGQYLLVQEASGGANGVALPTPDVTDSTPINMSATAGKVALANIATTLGCNGGSIPCSPYTMTLIVDLVGFGAANFYETAPAPAPSVTNAIFRANGGCTDTDNNSTDFSAAAAAPVNSLSLFTMCAGPTNPTGVGAATPSAVFAGNSTLLTVAVTPGANPTSTGLAVAADRAQVGGAGIL